MNSPTENLESIAIIGGGPAGLMAAQVLVDAGFSVAVYDSKPSVGRKFLVAGIGGMNITHNEALDDFLKRYRPQHALLDDIIRSFPPEALRAWVHEFGIATFVGSSGKVFPDEMKAAPLLRSWLHKLKAAGVQFYTRHQCVGLEQGVLHFQTRQGLVKRKHPAILLATGGASWPKLGSDGKWQDWLDSNQVQQRPLIAANCGFNVAWSDFMKARFAGTPLKNISLSFTDHTGQHWCKRSEIIISEYGLEGSGIYALSAILRDTLQQGPCQLSVDLCPELSQEQVLQRLEKRRKGMSLGNTLKKQLKLSAVAVALLHEYTGAEQRQDHAELAKALKALSITLTSPRPVSEAISSAGGVCFEALDTRLMLKTLPGVFCAGEMLDWEAPTGGYLLTACFATGRWAGQGMVEWLKTTRHP